jgi:hypothetical protein
LSRERRCAPLLNQSRNAWAWPFALVIIALAACTEDAHIYPGFFGQRVVGNETYVTVSNVWNEMDALPLADKHCRQYDKSARFTHMEGQRAIYDCVRPSD